ncbi:MAG: hypothetical protein FJ247_08595 [Nitrospira sp.]|nr:hypothetical protein [Nitrospira sp.]
MSDAKPLFPEMLKRGITGLVLGLIAGAIQVWFLKQDLSHLWASMAAGVLYMTAWTVLTEWFRFAGGNIVLGAVSGVIAAIVWWAIAMPAENVFLQAAVAGACFGATYAWSDRRMT